LARYYNSRTGTFCSADPLAGSAGDPQSWNRYEYGRGDPIDITDPSGQHWWNWALLGATLVADVFTFGQANWALEGEASAGWIGAADASAAATAAAAATMPQGQPNWDNAMNETLGMPHGWTPPGGLSPFSGIDSLNQALGLPSMADLGGPSNNLTRAGRNSSCGLLDAGCIDWKQLAQMAAMFNRMFPRPRVCGQTRMLVTGYDNSFQSTGKNPGDPGYGLVADMDPQHRVAGPGTIAAPKNYPFGTRMNVPGYGWGTVYDRGGAINGAHIDLWFPTTQQAMNWGHPHLNVTVCVK
jgi:3D (Asp-Asp-Asp) domain-containing protein